MKKSAGRILMLGTCIFAAFAAGFFAGRFLNRTPVRIYQTPPRTDESLPEAAPEAVSTPEPGIEAEPLPTGPVLVNINTADADTLLTLPGVGPALAQRIIDYRTENGSFRAVEELSKVKGIGESKLRDILDLITTGGEQ